MRGNKRPVTYMERQTMKYIPRGEMCIVCKHVTDDCSNLPFAEYKKIAKPDNEGYVEVKCEMFKRLENK